MKNGNFRIFYIALSILLFCISLPVFSGKIPFAGRYLVQQFAPWANDRRSGLETNLSHKPVDSDDLQLFYPNRSFTISSLLRGELPLWNPYILSGTPHLGQSETAVLYPLFLLPLVLPQTVSWAILVLSEPLLAGIGMYLFLRRLIGDRIASAFGALAFGFSGVILVRMVEGLSVGHTLLWAPFVLWGVESFLSLRDKKYLITTLLFLTLSVLAGWLQYTFYIFFLSFGYAVIRIVSMKEKGKLRTLAIICLPFVFLPLAALPHIYPAAQVFLASPRLLTVNSSEILIHLMPIQHLLSLFVPDLWGNPGTYTFFGNSAYKESVMWIALVPMIFAITAIIKERKNIVVRFFCVVILLTFLTAIQNPISSFIITSNIPLLSTFLPNRIFALTIIAFSVLSAYGMRYVIAGPERVKRSVLYITLGIIILFIATGIVSFIIYLQTPDIVFRTLPKLALLGIRLRSLILPLICACSFFIASFLFLKKKTLTIFIIVVFVFMGIQQVSFARKYHEWSETKYIYPTHPIISFLEKNAGFDRVLGVGSAHISSNISQYFGLYSAEGIAPNFPLKYAQFAGAAFAGPSGIGNVGRVEVRIAPTQKNLFVENNPALLKLLAISGTRYIITWDGDEDTIPDDDIDLSLFTLVMKDGLWRIFEYKRALPRAFLTTDFEVVTKTDVLGQVFDAKNEKGRVVLSESPDIQNDPLAAGTAGIVKLTADSVTIKTHADKAMLLYLSDSYWPDFVCLVDGTKVPILEANFAYRAVSLPAGNHTVVFSYDMFKERVAFAVAGFVWLGVCCLWLWRKNDTI
jgi:hypothetical protein